MAEASFSPHLAIDTERYSVTHHRSDELGRVTLLGHCLATQAEFEPAANAALRQKNPGLLGNLAGNYSVVMDYGDEQIIATDPAGQFPFYYKRTPEGVQLADGGGKLGSAPDGTYLGSYVLDFTELTGDRTGLQGVWRLGGDRTAYIAAGQLVSITETDDESPEVLNATEAFENLRHAILEAVGRRTNLGPTLTSDFSGGYDSTTLAYLAADLLPDGIDAFASYAPCLPTGDLYYARQIAEANPNVRLHVRREEPHTLPFTDMLQPSAISASPYVQLTNSRWIVDYMALLHRHGSRYHMTGTGGDEIFASSANMIRLAQEGDLEGLRETAQAKGRFMNTNPQHFYDKAIYDSQATPADDLRALAHLLRHPEEVQPDLRPSRYSWYTLPEEHIPLLAPPMRRHLSEAAEKLADSQVRRGIQSLPRLAPIQPGGDTQYYLQQYGRAFGIDVHAPYLDRQVVKASLPTSRLPSVPGIFKYPLRQALGDLLPDILLNRNTKSGYGGTYYKGLRTNWNDIISLFTKDCRLAEREIIDRRRVIEALHVLDSGQQGALSGIRQVISAEVWLRLLEKS